MVPSWVPQLTLYNLELARSRFYQAEPRDLFYRASRALIERSRQPGAELDLAESIAVLLQTWNRSFYRYRKGFTEQDFAGIRAFVEAYREELEAFSRRRLVDLSDQDRPVVRIVFSSVEPTLGPVGAAKALHLLAPLFFPLWDRGMTLAYRIYLKPVGQNAESYLRWMDLTIGQIRALGGWDVIPGNPLKAIDQFNYCVFARRWSLEPVGNEA